MPIYTPDPNLSKRPLGHLEFNGSDSPGRVSKSQFNQGDYVISVPAAAEGTDVLA